MDDAVRAQYSAPPITGLRRYWMGWYSWAEDFPDCGFVYWVSGTCMDYRLKPSSREKALAKGLPDRINPISTSVSDADADEFYISEGVWVGMVDAADPEAAWKIVREAFPDARDRDEGGTSFCFDRPDETLELLNKSGRFLS